MYGQHINSFDQRFGEFLRKGASPISRRSLLGRGMKVLLGLAGVSIAGLGSIPLLANPPGWGRKSKQGQPDASDPSGAIPKGFDTTCENLHGVLCSGNC